MFSFLTPLLPGFISLDLFFPVWLFITDQYPNVYPPELSSLG